MIHSSSKSSSSTAFILWKQQYTRVPYFMMELAARLSEKKNSPTVRFMQHHNIGDMRCAFTQVHVQLYTSSMIEVNKSPYRHKPDQICAFFVYRR